MKVKELLALLATVDQELEIAVLNSDDEYWGKIYGYADFARITSANVNGPKQPDVRCLVIE